MKDNKFDDLDKRVKLYIQGPHGKIGIIVPEKTPEETERAWIELHDSLARIVTNSIRKSAAEDKLKEQKEATSE